MAQKDDGGLIASYTRGAELFMHQTRLFLVALRNVLLLSLIVCLCVGGFYVYKMVDETDAYSWRRNMYAKFHEAMQMNGKIDLVVGGELKKLDREKVLELTQDGADEIGRHLRNGALFGILSAIGSAALISLVWYGFGKKKMADQQLRGSRLVTGKELAKQMRQRDDVSPYELAGVPIRKKAETLHTLIAGAQGTGKSQQFFNLMRQVRKRGKRAVVYDPTGEFVAAFYREGRDIILNPMDERSPLWTIWNEIARDYHFDNMANGLIPDPPDVDPFWAKAGRMVLKDTYRVLGREGRRTNKDLYNAIAKSNLDSLHALLAGTAGATYVDPLTERTGMSLKMTVQNQLESFRFLRDDGESFSIRNWVNDEESDQWLFIVARESQREALKPVLSLWIDTVIKAVLDLQPIHQERMWAFLDELPTLQKLDILKLALTNTRKYGLCIVIGVQDFSQLIEIYGEHLARTIISGCQTKLLLRVTDGDAAEMLSKLLGESELDEKEESLSYGVAAQRDGVSVNSKRQLRDIVLSSEILTLPDMTGYIATPGDYPIGRVSYEFQPHEVIATGFIERDGFLIDFSPKRNQPNGGAAAGNPQKEQLPVDDLLADEPPLNEQLREVEPIFDEVGRAIDPATGEVLHDPTVSRAKETAPAASKKGKANPLADAL